MKDTSCFAAVFKLFCCYFHTFCVAFLEFWRISEIFQKILFLKKFWKIYESRDFLLPTIQKWRKLAVLLLFSKFSASFSLLLAVLLLFSNFLRCFSRILTNFRNFSEILVRNISEINQIYPVPQQAGQKVSNLISFLTSSQDFRSRKKPWDKKFQPHLRTRPVKTVHTIHEGQTHYTPR